MTPIERIDDVRRELIARSFQCISGGKFGLKSYSDIEVWSLPHKLIYFVYDGKTGGWDILTSIDNTNNVDNTWEALDRLISIT